MKNKFFKGLVASFALTISCAANAGLITISADVDQTISDANQDGVPDGFLSASDVYLRTGFYGTHWRSALEFDLSAIGTFTEVLSADLFLQDRGASRSGTLNLWGYFGDGIISLDDATETGNLLGTMYINRSAGIQNFNLNVASFIQSAIDSDEQFAGFLIGAATPSGFGGAASDMCSSESASSSWCDVPLLTINSVAPDQDVPEPSTLAVFALGLIGLASRKFKKQA